jgi:hypothetical protein
MSWSTGGMLTPGNVDAIYHALKNVGNVDGKFLEIGCFCGLSSNLITFLKRALGISKPLFSVDPWIYGAAEARTATLTDFTSVKWEEYQAFVRAAYRSRVGFYSRDDLPHAIEQYSGDFMQLWNDCAVVTDVFGRRAELGGPLAFAFIDGDHSYEGSKEDFINIDRHLASGGYILFDDSGDGDGRGCHRTAREASKHARYELVSKNPNYLIRKR